MRSRVSKPATASVAQATRYAKTLNREVALRVLRVFRSYRVDGDPTVNLRIRSGRMD